jgi:hypothetical protein
MSHFSRKPNFSPKKHSAMEFQTVTVTQRRPKAYKKTVINGEKKPRGVSLTDSEYNALLSISPAGHDGKPSLSKLLAKMAKNIKEGRHI